MSISIYLFFAIMIGGFVILPLIFRLGFENKKWARVLCVLLFVIYVGIMLCLTLGEVGFGKVVTINLKADHPWCNKTIHFFDASIFSWRDALINFAMLTPVGIFLWKSKRSWWKNLLIALLGGLIFGLSIETLQFILPISRTVQVQDAVFNGISSMLGALFIQIIYAIFGRKHN
ncbi:MAG: hypothetical protein E7378_02380 [Clostridiales bacterium]|nr:hypothetical protein [Clostridiales bacterium]